ncbi:MAG TPA: tyrosine-type recombinase/integrase [Paraburkholderia sp.]
MNRQFRFSRKTIDALPSHPSDARSTESEYSDTDVAGLRLLVNRLGRKYFLLRYTINSRKRSMKLGDYPALDVGDARLKALECRAQLAKGLDPQAIRQEEAASVVRTLRIFVQDEYMPHARATKRSAEDDEARLRIHLLPAFGDQPMNEITSQALQQYHDRKKYQLSPASANRHLALVKRIYNVGIMWGHVEKNPARGIRMHQENNQRHRYLSGDELRRFIAAAGAEANRTVADALCLLLATGTRREEALQAKWQDIDLDRQRWFLPKTKSGKSRFVLLNEMAMGILKSRARTDSPFVFPGRHDRMKPLNNPHKAFRRILTNAKIADLRVHDLRHTFASLAINQGASLYEVQHLLGHANSITTTRYAHLASDRLRQASEQVALVIGTTGSQQPDGTTYAKG